MTHLASLRHYARSLLTEYQLEAIADMPVTGKEGLRRYLAELSFEAFVDLYFADEFTLEKPAIHHDMISDCQEVIERAREERKGVKLAKAIPRGMGKSTYYARLLPLHGLLYGWSKLTVLLGNTQTAAERLLRNIRDTLESNEVIIEDFGIMRGDIWHNSRIDTKEANSIVAFGVGNGAIRGISNPYRPRLIIGDDLDDDSSVRSAIELSANKEWFDKAVMSLGDNIAFTTSYIVVGTLIRKTSLLRHVLDSPDFDSIVKQGVLKDADNRALWEQWQQWYTAQSLNGNQPKDAERDTFYQQHKQEMNKGALVLWPREDAYYYLMLYKLARGEKAFNSEIQNTPQNTETRLGTPLYTDIPPQLDHYELIGALDPTLKGNKNNDYAAWVEILFNRRTKEIIVSYVDAKQRGYDETVQTIVTRITKSKKRYDGIYCEANSMGAIIADSLQAELQSQGAYYFVTQVHNKLPKNERIDILGHYIANGQLKFARDINPIIIKELEDFPYGQHDDSIDALSTIVLQMRDKKLLDIVKVNNNDAI